MIFTNRKIKKNIHEAYDTSCIIEIIYHRRLNYKYHATYVSYEIPYSYHHTRVKNIFFLMHIILSYFSILFITN